MREKGLPEVIVRTEMSLCGGASTKVKVGSELSEEFLVQVGVHQKSVLSPLIFSTVVDVITENAREGFVNEIWYENDMVSMSKIGRF